MPIVRLPDGRQARFPDDMPREQIKAFISEKFPQTVAKPLSDEQQAQIKQQAQQNLANAGYDSSGWGIAKEALKGAGKGIVGGAEALLNGATFGGYNWAADKLGLDASGRREELKESGAGIPLAATDFVGGLASGGALLKGAGIAAGMIPRTTKGLKALSTIAGLSKYPATGAIEGGLNAGFSGDSLDSAKEGAIGGGIAGAVVPAALWGAGKVISKAVPSVLGMTSGSGERSIKQAYDAGKRGSKEFVENMRGIKSKEDVVDLAKKSLTGLKQAKNTEYTKAMSEIKGKEGVELKPILDKFKEISKTEAGGKKYLVDEDTAKFLKKAGEKINAFAKDPSKKTLGDFDNLKQAIGNINVGKDARRAAQVQGELYSAIKDEIKKQAPIYDQIMKPYSQAAEEVRNIEKALSLGKGAEIDTTLRKLQSAFRNNVASNYGNRGDLVNRLGSKELSDAVSGQLLSTVAPRGGVARLGGLAAGGYGLYGGLNPTAIATLPAFSPRVVGETAYGLGRLANETAKIAPKATRDSILIDLIGQLSRKGE